MALWPPAAAISKALFMFSYPFTSEKSAIISETDCSKASLVFTTVGAGVFFPLKNSMASNKLSIPITSKSLTMAASLAFALGNTSPLKPSSHACIAIGKAPLRGCKPPSKDSSPIMR